MFRPSVLLFGDSRSSVGSFVAYSVSAHSVCAGKKYVPRHVLKSLNTIIWKTPDTDSYFWKRRLVLLCGYWLEWKLRSKTWGHLYEVHANNQSAFVLNVWYRMKYLVVAWQKNWSKWMNGWRLAQRRLGTARIYSFLKDRCLTGSNRRRKKSISGTGRQSRSIQKYLIN
jgi:hypothetical protein